MTSRLAPLRLARAIAARGGTLRLAVLSTTLVGALALLTIPAPSAGTHRAREARLMRLAPQRLSGPARRTRRPVARFWWHAPRGGASGFRCRLDKRPLRRCHSGLTYLHLSPGTHTFTVFALHRGRRMVPARGNAGSPPPSWRWTILKAQPRLTISGNVGGLLYPGASPVPIDLLIDNRTLRAVRITRLTVSIQALHAPHATAALPCTAADFAVGGFTGKPFEAPAGPSTLASDNVPGAAWPTLQMRERPFNQDGCSGAEVSLRYRVTAELPTPKRHAKRNRRGMHPGTASHRGSGR